MHRCIYACTFNTYAYMHVCVYKALIEIAENLEPLSASTTACTYSMHWDAAKLKAWEQSYSQKINCGIHSLPTKKLEYTNSTEAFSNFQETCKFTWFTGRTTSYWKLTIPRHTYILFFSLFLLSRLFLCRSREWYSFLCPSSLAPRPHIHINIRGVAPKTPAFGVLWGSTLKTPIGVGPSMRLFGLGTSRLRFDASRSRRELASARP